MMKEFSAGITAQTLNSCRDLGLIKPPTSVHFNVFSFYLT